MKLCTFCEVSGIDASMRPPDSGRLGAVVSSGGIDQVIDLADAYVHPAVSGGATGTAHPESAIPEGLRTMQGLLEAGPDGMARVAALLERIADLEGPFRRPLSAVTLLAPLPRPQSIRDCMAFERHFLQAMRGGARFKLPAAARIDALTRKFLGLSLIRVPALYREIPAYYKGNPRSVVGPDAEVRWPAYSERLDYELEVGLYIHKAGRDLDPDTALEHIAGYTLFNDFSARDTQIREMDLRLGPAKGKDFDTGNVMGPWLVTPDEVGDIRELEAVGRVNGEVWTRSSTRDLQFSVGEILTYISQSETLFPGDFIALGTVPDGCGLELDRWLKPGDVVELEVSRLGVLRNRVVR